MIRSTSVFVLLFVSATFAIGFQHGIFRSQATQGATWTGTATIIKEDMKVTVQRDYLDVDLEWIFKADGVKPAQYDSSLEIVGNLNLNQGSVVVGMILWYKDKMLKAKLKRKEIARQQYEQVVDRNAVVPPRPRDPVILEYRGNDNYDISIFPVIFQGTRRLRFRYLVPMTLANGSMQAGFPYAFTSDGVVTVKKGEGLSGFKITNSAGTSVTCTDSVQFKNVLAYSYSVSGTPNTIIPQFPTDSLSKKTTMEVSNIDNVLMPGELVKVSNFAVSQFLDSLKAYIATLGAGKKAGTLNIFASIGNGTSACSTGVSMSFNDVAQLSSNIDWGRSLNIYTVTPIVPKVIWSAYVNGEMIYKLIEVPNISASLNSAVTSKLIAGSQTIISLEQKLPKSLAATFGFVDTTFALLALEDDVLPNQLAAFYENTGVPVCNEEDVFADTSDMVSIPATGLYDPNYNVYRVNTINSGKSLIGNFEAVDPVTWTYVNKCIIITLHYNTIDGNEPIELTMFSISGKCLGVLHRSDFGGSGTVRWSPRTNGISSGSVIMRIKIGNKIATYKTIPLL